MPASPQLEPQLLYYTKSALRKRPDAGKILCPDNSFNRDYIKNNSPIIVHARDRAGVIHARAVPPITLSGAAASGPPIVVTPPMPSDAGQTTDTTNSIFIAQPPSIHDINQGNVADCYYLGPLGAIALMDPAAVWSIFTQPSAAVAQSRMVKNGQVYYVQGNMLLPSEYAHAGADKATWSMHAEKHWAHFRTGADTYASIGWGTPNETFAALGYDGLSIAPTNPGVVTTVATWLSQSFPVTACTLPSFTGAALPLITSHVYALVSVKINPDGSVSWVFYNVWGYDGVNADSNPSDGLVTLTSDQVARGFSAIVCGDNPTAPYLPKPGAPAVSSVALPTASPTTPPPAAFTVTMGQNTAINAAQVVSENSIVGATSMALQFCGYQNGPWYIEFSITPPAAGTYKLSALVACPNPVNATVSVNGKLAATIPVQTAGWNNFATVDANVSLPAGPSKVRFAGLNNQVYNLGPCMFSLDNQLTISAVQIFSGQISSTLSPVPTKIAATMSDKSILTIP